jgi:translation elongation factor P/translation initiation factor 5A
MVMIDGQECMVADISTAKTGKHGAAKTLVTVIDPATGQKKDKMMA